MIDNVTISVPDAVRPIADSEDRKLAWHFFILFSRMEYALKRSEHYLKKGTTKAQPDWEKFASDYKGAFHPDSSVDLRAAVDFFRSNPPRKQLVQQGKMDWSPPQMHDGKEPELVWLVRMVRCVRNNLFHGGKFPLIPVSDPSRDRELLLHSMRILKTCLGF